jgi:hypothetical protein
MIVGPALKQMQGYPRNPDPDVKAPYVKWAETPFASHQTRELLPRFAQRRCSATNASGLNLAIAAIVYRHTVNCSPLPNSLRLNVTSEEMMAAAPDPFAGFKADQRVGWSLFTRVEMFTTIPAAKLVKFAQVVKSQLVLDVS